ARSDGVDRGSEFIVRLPALADAPRAALPQPPVADSSPAAERRRILVVDDNADAARSQAMLFELEGHEVRSAYDGPQAMGLAASLRRDIALLDIGVPSLDGYGVARWIRSQPWGAAIELVAVTGWGQEQDRRRTHQAGFNAHLVKPVAPEVVLQLLAGLPAP